MNYRYTIFDATGVLYDSNKWVESQHYHNGCYLRAIEPGISNSETDWYIFRKEGINSYSGWAYLGAHDMPPKTIQMMALLLP